MSQENPSKLDRGIEIGNVVLTVLMVSVQIFGMFRGRAPKIPA